jgi:hypothetical protein
MAFVPDPAVEAEISELEKLPLKGLRDLWRERLGVVPKHQSADLPRRRLAYELQVRAYGGLRIEVRRRLTKLHKAFASDPTYTPQASQRLKFGAVLTREWKGVTHQLCILQHGFEYSGENYQSLSDIARRISGTWRRLADVPFARANLRRRGWISPSIRSMPNVRCEAHIKSPSHEGWQLVDAKYSDRGSSDGDLDRPVLKRLMTDLKQGQRAGRNRCVFRFDHAAVQEHNVHGAASGGGYPRCVKDHVFLSARISHGTCGIYVHTMCNSVQ